MKSTKTFSISFLARKCKPNSSTGLLFARISVNQTRVEYSLKRKVPIDDWDKKKGRCISKGHYTKVINQYLSQIHGEIFEAYDQIRRAHGTLSAQAIKARWLDEDSESFTLLQAFQYHYKVAQQTIREGTLKNYRTTEKYVRLYLKSDLQKEDLELKHLSYSFITRFENFLRLHEPLDHQRKMENNTVMKHIQRFRKIINMCVRMEWIEKDPFAKFKAKYIRRDRVYLTASELH